MGSRNPQQNQGGNNKLSNACHQKQQWELVHKKYFKKIKFNDAVGL